MILHNSSHSSILNTLTPRSETLICLNIYSSTGDALGVTNLITPTSTQKLCPPYHCAILKQSDFLQHSGLSMQWQDDSLLWHDKKNVYWKYNIRKIMLTWCVTNDAVVSSAILLLHFPDSETALCNSAWNTQWVSEHTDGRQFWCMTILVQMCWHVLLKNMLRRMGQDIKSANKENKPHNPQSSPQQSASICPPTKSHSRQSTPPLPPHNSYIQGPHLECHALCFAS